MSSWRVLCWVSLCMGLWSCGGSAVASLVTGDVARGDYAGALSRYETQGRSPEILRALSESVLLSAARSRVAAERRAAFIELSMLGTRAEALLAQLSASGESALVRAEALRLQSRMGDMNAREALRRLIDHPDPEVADSAFAALQPGPDDALIVRALGSPRRARRAAALSQLARAPHVYYKPLSAVSHLDPDPQLRAAALRALEGYGPAAADAFEAATHDPDVQVRVAGLSGLAKVAPEWAVPILDQQLGAAVSRESIAAACALLSLARPRAPERARAALLSALRTPDRTLRAQAASAIQLLPADRRDRKALRERLRVEPVASIRLSLSLALGPDDPASRRALAALSTASSLAGAEAAAELAPLSRQARSRLRLFSKHESVLVRATAARLIARTLHDPRPITRLLADVSWRVRDAAAGALLNVL